MSSVGIIVQARYEAGRLPGKVLRLLCGQPMLLWQLARLRAHFDCWADLVVACPQSAPTQTHLLPLLQRHGYRVMAPPVPAEDVLGRYAHIVLAHPSWQWIVRVTGDCPLLDPRIVHACLAMIQDTGCDHVGPAFEWPEGLSDCDVMTRQALLWAHAEATDPVQREHVTPYIWSNQPRFRCLTVPCPFDLSEQQWSVDTEDDLELVSSTLSYLLAHCGWNFTWHDVWYALRAVPHLAAMMDKRTRRNSAYEAQVGEDWKAHRYGNNVEQHTVNT